MTYLFVWIPCSGDEWRSICLMLEYQHRQVYSDADGGTLGSGKQTFNAYAGITADVFVMNDSVESQAVDPLNRRFVVGSHQGSVKMFDIVDGTLSETPQWNLELGDIPCSKLVQTHHGIVERKILMVREADRKHLGMGE
ncbi:hypothetical protein EDD18DRAFT_1104557 [Armillaria luteobubalina]|uniref:WD40 repeat-like protein n=1 Tax=Armillaria luteobubalina TaxID=153913 RepID=A0AA39UTT7_9AGAR|nr:hypothetical protein EDD18DRAFT_1104557 [Armillaria luteobubalina]